MNARNFFHFIVLKFTQTLQTFLEWQTDSNQFRPLKGWKNDLTKTPLLKTDGNALTRPAKLKQTYLLHPNSKFTKLGGVGKRTRRRLIWLIMVELNHLFCETYRSFKLNQNSQVKSSLYKSNLALSKFKVL